MLQSQIFVNTFPRYAIFQPYQQRRLFVYKSTSCGDIFRCRNPGWVTNRRCGRNENPNCAKIGRSDRNEIETRKWKANGRSERRKNLAPKELFDFRPRNRLILSKTRKWKTISTCTQPLQTSTQPELQKIFKIAIFFLLNLQNFEISSKSPKILKNSNNTPKFQKILVNIENFENSNKSPKFSTFLVNLQKFWKIIVNMQNF